MKLYRSFLLLLLPAVALIIYTYETRVVVSTEYPSCGGGYFTAPTGPGIYSLPCIAADRPTKYTRDNSKLYISLDVFAGILLIDTAIYANSRKKTKS